MILIELTGKPTPWSAPQQGLRGFYDKKSKDKEFVRWQIKSQYRGTPIQGFVAIDFKFFIPIPKNTSKAQERQMLLGQILPTTPDTTNMQKLYEDCLQGIVIENDRYANRVASMRVYSDKPGVMIMVRPWAEYLQGFCTIGEKESLTI